MEPIRTKEINGHTIKIYYDSDPSNPREDCDWLGTMVCWHSRYNLGDPHRYANTEFFKLGLAKEIDPEIENKIYYWESDRGWRSLQARLSFKEAAAEAGRRVSALIDRILDKHYVILPLYLYDHSGIAMSVSPFSCPWDSGQVGYVYAGKKELLKEFGKRRLTKTLRKRAVQILTKEIEAYDRYLAGQIYGYEIENGDGEEIDSGWGFDDLEYCLKSAEERISAL